MEGFYRQEGEGKRREQITSSSFSSFRGQRGPMWQVTSLVPTRKFQTDWLRLPS